MPERPAGGAATAERTGAAAGRGGAAGAAPLRIAFFTSVSPVPARSGYQLRCFHAARALVAAGHDVHLFSFDPQGAAAGGAPPREVVAAELGIAPEAVHVVASRRTSLGDVVRALPRGEPLHVRTHRSGEMRRLLRAAGARGFDVAYMNFLYFAPYRDEFGPRTLTVVDQHNCDRDVWRSYVRSAPGVGRRAFALLNLWKTMRFERRVYDACDVCVCVSDRDRETTRGISPHPLLVTAPNGADVARMAGAAGTERAAAPTVLFVGGAADRNTEAVLRLHRDVMPRVRRRVPGARLRVAGTVCGTLPAALRDDPAVEVLGTMDDIAGAYRGAWAVAVPSTLGGGTKLKMVEALAAGLPVVGSVNAFQGFDLPPDLGEMVHDRDDGLAAALVRVIEDPALWRRLADSGVRFAEGYDWSWAMRPMLDAVAARAAARGGA